MSTLPVWEKIILHLNQYRMTDSDDRYNAPWDLTQDGIASSLRISRAHSSIELKKLRLNGKVVENYSHIKGKDNKRKTYFLTAMGMADAQRIRDRAEREGIDFASMLDMKRCDPCALLDTFDDKGRDVLGIACILRCSVKRDELPETERSVVPVDVNGYVSVDEETKANILSVLDGDSVKRLHSLAADFWLSSRCPDRQERLYHLVVAGRNHDACRSLIKEKDRFMDSLNDDLYDILQMLTDIPEKYLVEILPLKIISAIEFGDLEGAAPYLASLLAADKDAGTLFSARIELRKGEAGKALEMLREVQDSVPKALLNAEALALSGELTEAKGVLDTTREKMMLSGDLRHLSELYLLSSTVSIRMGRPEDALLILNKAKSSAGPFDLHKIYRKLSEVYSAMELAEEIKCF